MQDTPPPPDWRELSALYDQAEAMAPAERSDWLAGLEARGHLMAPRLRKMLSAPDGFLEALPQLSEGDDSGAFADAMQGTPDERVGAYRLLRLLGAGGMAEVWLAERADGAFERRVALKLLFTQPGAARRETFRRRFEREHRILAALRHEHIAALHDAGVTPEGQHWLALEYVAGEPIDQWCDVRRLGLRPRVVLFQQVLQAVAHAHARLVIHRDLKPSNVMVTETGQVRLLDFGIATLLDDDSGARDATDLTRAGGRPMTPRYASPEQLQGLPLNATSDVYALGVMLYELLCGQAPYAPAGCGSIALERAILEAEPLPPSRQAVEPDALAARHASARLLRGQLAGDLDAIVLRAMARNSADRYGSADALAADLARWLAGEPVQARLPGPMARAWKFGRRHPWGTGLGAAAMLALGLAAGVAVVSARQASADAERARAASGFMLRLFEDADPDRYRGQALTPAQLLARGRERLMKGESSSPLLRSELLEGIARAQNDMADYGEAETTYADWVALCRTQCEPSRLAWALTLRAENDMRRQRLADAKQWLNQADAALADAAAAPALRAKRHEVRGWVAYREGRLQDADAAFGRGLKALPGMGSGADRQAADLWQGYARSAAEIGDAQRAIAGLDSAARHVAVLSQDRPSAKHDLAQFRADVLYRLAQYGRVDEMAPADLEQCERELAVDSKPCRFLRTFLALSLIRLGKGSQLSSAWPATMAIADRVDTEPDRMNALQLVHRYALQTGDSAARAQAMPRLEAMERDAASPVTRIRAAIALAESALHDGNADSAFRRLARAQVHAREGGLTNSYFAAQMQLTEGLAWQLAGKSERALHSMEQAQAVFDAELKPTHPLALWFGLNRVRPLRALGRGAQADALVQAALPVLQRSWGAKAPAVERVEALGAQTAAERAQVLRNSASDPPFN